MNVADDPVGVPGFDVLDKTWPEDKEAPITFVVIPEYVARRWWERILYNQSANRLRSALLAGRSPYRVTNPRNAVAIETRSVSLLERAPGVQKLAVPKPSGDAPRLSARPATSA